MMRTIAYAPILVSNPENKAVTAGEVYGYVAGSQLCAGTSAAFSISAIMITPVAIPATGSTPRPASAAILTVPVTP